MQGKKQAAFIMWLFEENKDIVNTWMRGQINSIDICRMISTKFHIPFKTLWTELVYSCKTMGFCSDKIPVLLSKLREKGYKVVLATDNMDIFKKYTFVNKYIYNYFDSWLISCESGFLKQDFSLGILPFFHGYIKSHNLEYSNCLLLDDSIKESSNFHTLGLRGIKITSPESLIAHLESLLVQS